MNVPATDWVVIRAMILGWADSMKPVEGESSSPNLMSEEKILSFVAEVDRELNFTA